MLVVIVREIWIHKNRVVFKNGIADCEEIFYLALIKGWSWVKFRTRGILFSVCLKVGSGEYDCLSLQVCKLQGCLLSSWNDAVDRDHDKRLGA